VKGGLVENPPKEGQIFPDVGFIAEDGTRIASSV
jgi:hypothetical protein